jgi:hypothetical protein
VKKSLPKNIPNPDQVDEFKGYMKKWQQTLGLEDWRIEHVPLEAINAMASVKVNYSARLARYRLGDFGAEEINAKTLDATALHEALHVLLYELLHQTGHDFDQETLESTEHRVINTLEKLLMKDAG